MPTVYDAELEYPNYTVDVQRKKKPGLGHLIVSVIVILILLWLVYWLLSNFVFNTNQAPTSSIFPSNIFGNNQFPNVVNVQPPTETVTIKDRHGKEVIQLKGRNNSDCNRGRNRSGRRNRH